MAKSLSVIAICSALVATAFANDKCYYSHKKGGKSYNYDLTRVYHPIGSSDSFYIQDPTSMNTYYVNLCGESYYSTSGYYDCMPGSSICRKDLNYRYSSYGLLESQSIVPCTETDVVVGQGITVTYSRGDACGSGKKSASVHVRCSDTADPGFLYDVTESNDDCNAIIYMYSVVGCAEVKSAGGLGAGGIILIILVVLVVAYFVGGAIYQWKFKEAKEPLDFIIHRDFWFSIPGLVKDGALFVAHGFKKGDYTSI